jgi:hypothetical protein
LVVGVAAAAPAPAAAAAAALACVCAAAAAAAVDMRTESTLHVWQLNYSFNTLAHRYAFDLSMRL